MTKLVAPITPRLDDKDAERVRRAHDEAIRGLQGLPSSGMIILSGITLADTVVTPVKHGLGRKPKIVVPSAIRGATSAGVIIQSSSTDSTAYINLKAISFGATITVDLLVM